MSTTNWSQPNGKATAATALGGMRVIDFSTFVMGPYAAQLLGDLGADVIKVESPQGDNTRWGDYSRHPSLDVLFLQVNRNKRSVVLDLADPDAHAAFLELVKTADVLIVNLREPSLRKLGLSYEDLHAINPRLIYCHAQGFRADSVAAGTAAYDEIIQACTGLTDLMRRLTGTPNYMPTMIADKVCSLYIAYSVLAAVVHRERTGQGQLVGVPMADTMFAFTMIEHLMGDVVEPPAGPAVFPRAVASSHKVNRTSDGWAAIVPYNPQNLIDVCTFAGRPELADDPRWNTQQSFIANYSQMQAMVEELTPTHTTAEWFDFCNQANVPVAPMLDVDKAKDSAYYRDGGVVVDAEHPAFGSYRIIASPIRYSETPAGLRHHPPVLGGNSVEILTELGLSAGTIEGMVSRGATMDGTAKTTATAR